MNPYIRRRVTHAKIIWHLNGTFDAVPSLWDQPEFTTFISIWVGNWEKLWFWRRRLYLQIIQYLEPVPQNFLRKFTPPHWFNICNNKKSSAARASDTSALAGRLPSIDVSGRKHKYVKKKNVHVYIVNFFIFSTTRRMNIADFTSQTFSSSKLSYKIIQKVLSFRILTLVESQLYSSLLQPSFPSKFHEILIE